jgi:hypothetical protein
MRFGEPDEAPKRVLWAKRTFLLIIAMEPLSFFAVGVARKGLADGGVSALRLLMIGGFFLAIFGLSWWSRVQRAVSFVFAAAVLASAFIMFPVMPNHSYTYVLIPLFLVLLDERTPEGASDILACWRWLAVVIVFGAGVQKLRYGQYDQGEFLAFQLVNDSRMTHLRPLLCPGSCMDVLLARSSSGIGWEASLPWIPGRILSIGVLVAELALPVLLFFRKTRWWGALTILFTLSSIQIYAREFEFAIALVALMLLFSERPTQRLGLGVCVGLWVVAAISGFFLW